MAGVVAELPGLLLTVLSALHCSDVQTLHFADKDLFETLLVELLAGVSYFARPRGSQGSSRRRRPPGKLGRARGGSEDCEVRPRKGGRPGRGCHSRRCSGRGGRGGERLRRGEGVRCL